MNSHVPTFFINLDHDTGRREALERRLDALGLPHQHFPGVYGKTLPAGEPTRHYDHAHVTSQNRELTAGEVGCALDYFGVYRTMIEQNPPRASTLKDGTKLGPDVPAVLGALAQNVLPDEPVVALLTHIDRYYKRSARPLTAGYHTVKLASYQWLAHGYLVTRAAARRMVEQLYPVWLAANYWYEFEREGIVQMRAVVSYVVGVQDFNSDSNLEAGRTIKSRETDDRLGFGHHLRQIFVRKFLYQIFVRPFLGIVKQKKTW